MYTVFSAFELLGNDGWNWEKFHRYAKRVERFRHADGSYDADPDFRGLYNPESVGHDGELYGLS